MERQDVGDGCANGHHLEQYPDEFRGAPRLGINFKGHVEYWREGSVLSLIYEVGTDSISEMNTHDKLADDPLEHVENVAKRHGDWWTVEEWVKQ